MTMKFYQILINKRVPYSVLTYKSKEILETGQIVSCNLRKKLVYGVVVKMSESEHVLDPEKVSEIQDIFPYKFSAQQMKFHEIFSFNTFNDIHNTLDAFLQPIISLNQKQQYSLKNSINEVKKSLQKPNIKENKKVQYIISPQTVLRIRDIIRISILNNKNAQILIVAPEKKLIDSILSDLEIYSSEMEVSCLEFYGDKSKSSRETTMKCILNKTKNPQIIIGTRSSLFLPFTGLDSVILLDEANSLHIQEQNGLYFDAREVCFLLSEVFQTNISFISRVPSIRLHSFYQNQDIKDNSLNIIEIPQKSLKISLTRSNRKYDKNLLISDSVLQKIFKENDGTDVTWENENEEMIEI